MRRIAPAAAAAATALAGIIGAAQAAAAESPWIPYHQADFTVPKERSTCSFDVHVSVVRDEERYRNVELYENGSPRVQQWKGALVMRYTNLDGGASAVRDLSAEATVRYRPDGSMESMTSVHGAFGATMPVGSDPATGLYVLSGHGSAVTFREDGTRSFTLGPNGTAENVCEAID